MRSPLLPNSPIIIAPAFSVTCIRGIFRHAILTAEVWFSAGRVTKEAENVFLTHGWESGYRFAGGFQLVVRLGMAPSGV